jgi:Uma2 family endonuclease
MAMVMADTVTRKRFTAHEYHRMAEAGILRDRERVELMDGEILVMSPIGPRHDACIGSGNRVLVRAAGDDAIVFPQNSVRLDLYYEPQPDLALLRPRSDFYASRHAGPGDILLIVEIADASLAYDRDVKAGVYAAAGIPEYWLADLTTSVLWRYLSPERDAYRSVEALQRGQSIAPSQLPACLVPVDAFLIE